MWKNEDIERKNISYIHLFCQQHGAGEYSMHMRSEANPWESLLCFHHVDPRDRTQVLRLGGRSLNLLKKAFLCHGIPKALPPPMRS